MRFDVVTEAYRLLAGHGTCWWQCNIVHGYYEGTGLIAIDTDTVACSKCVAAKKKATSVPYSATSVLLSVVLLSKCKNKTTTTTTTSFPFYLYIGFCDDVVGFCDILRRGSSFSGSRWLVRRTGVRWRSHHAIHLFSGGSVSGGHSGMVVSDDDDDYDYYLVNPEGTRP